MIIQQLLKLCSCECATGASLRPSTITGVYGDEVPPVLIPNTEVKLIRADGTWLDTARESMSTPVSKTKALNISWVLFVLKKATKHCSVSSQGAERTADCCYMSHTTTHYFRPAKAWEREGVTPSHRGVKMSEQRDSSCGTRSGANASAFSRREKEHIARRRARAPMPR